MKNKTLYSILGLIIIIESAFLIHYYNKSKEEAKTLKQIETENRELLQDKLMNLLEENHLGFFDTETKTIDFEKDANQLKLNWAYLTLQNRHDFTKEINAKIIEETIENTFGSSNLILEDIICTCHNTPYLIYKKETNTYKINPNHELHNLKENRADENKVVSLKQTGDKIELTVHKLYAPFMHTNDENAYGSYIDLENRTNPLFSYDDVSAYYNLTQFDSNAFQKAIDYFDTIYDTLKTKMPKYRYTFIKSQNQFYLKKYEKID